MVEIHDGVRYHCPYCGWSTQLVNKFERHVEKKHADEMGIAAEQEGPADEEE